MKKLSDNQHPQTGNLEDVFREQFAQAEAEPRVSLWDRIEQDLDSGQVQVYKKRTVMYQRLAAACAALLFMFGAYAFYQELTEQPVYSPVLMEQPVVKAEQPVQHESATMPAVTTDEPQPKASQHSSAQVLNDSRTVKNSGSPQLNGIPAITAEEVSNEQHPEPVAESTPADYSPAGVTDAPKTENHETIGSEKESRSTVNVVRTPMKVIVDAPVRVALGRTVTVMNVPCATGLYGGLWLQLENGQYLKPVENTAGRKLKEGVSYQIDYEMLSSADNAESATDCKTELPAATPVKITRLKAL